MIASTAAMDIRPGSMSMPLPEVTAGIVKRTGPRFMKVSLCEIGELALRTCWLSMMRAYLYGVVAQLGLRPSCPFPLGSGDAHDLGRAEGREAVHEGDAGVDLGGLAVGVS